MNLAMDHWNSAPDSLKGALWPASRLGEAIHALARAAALPTSCTEGFTPPPGLTPDELDVWVRTAAERGGIQATRVLPSLDDIPALAWQAAPLLIRVQVAGVDGYVAIAGRRWRRLELLGPDLKRHFSPPAALEALLRRPFEAPFEDEIDQLLERLEVSRRRRSGARVRLISERLRNVRMRSCWLLRLPPGAPIVDEVRETRLLRSTGVLAAAHVLQYLLFVLSWFLLGRSVMNGRLDYGWLTGWLLLLFSLVPVRLVATAAQGALSRTAGAALRRRLLRGGLRVDRETVKHQGAGQLFGLVMEGAAIESLALTGGMASCFAIVELALAALVLWWAGGWQLGVLLVLWTAAALALSWQYLRSRRTWTAERLRMTEQMVDAMLGHRTRLAQQPSEEWHPLEDISLSRYLHSARVMDKMGIALSALIPRGWFAAALLVMAPAVAAGTSAGRLAATIGGILLAYRSLRRLAGGLANAGSAAIAVGSALPLIRAAAGREPAPHPSVVIPERRPTDAQSATLVAHARDLTFRYSHRTDTVLDGCSLAVAQGARLLLEGASGAGKTTLASLLAGLERPDGGMLLVDGLDRSVLGAAGWRQRVVMAPQAHDNYLMTGSLAFNLLLGRRWPAHHEDLVEAEQVCRELGLGDLLDRLPGGLHQVIGETGWQLSQGERTRVFLARALLQKPEFLILDESFSALDPENVDRTVRCVLRRAPAVLAIAHT